MIAGFTPSGAIPEEVIERFAPLVTPDIVALWRENGTGWLEGGFFRLVDPAHAAQRLEDAYPLPEGAVVVFTTALADLVVWARGMFYLMKWRWGVLEGIPHEGSLEQVLAWMRDPELLDRWFQWEPYPAAARHDGVPGLDDCFGFVPILALGGPNEADHLQIMDLWVHIALIHQLAGNLRSAGEFAPPDSVA